MKKNKNKEGWVSITYDGGSSLEVRHVTAQFVRETCEAAKVKYTSGNNFEVLKGNDFDQFIGFCRESYLAGSMMLLGMQFPFLRARRVKVVMFPKEKK